MNIEESLLHAFVDDLVNKQNERHKDHSVTGTCLECGGPLMGDLVSYKGYVTGGFCSRACLLQYLERRAEKGQD